MAGKRKKKPGRPEHRPTKETRQKVSVAAGGGMAHEEIALAMGMSRNTLEKHYAHELSLGAAEKRLEVLNALHRAAKQGKVAAIKEYLSNTPQVAAPPAPKPEPAGEAKLPEKLGKKEQAQLDATTAHHADHEWAGLLPGAKAPTTH